MVKRAKAVAGSFVLLAALVSGVAALIAENDGPGAVRTDPPLRLPWENPDGSLNFAGIPDSIEAVNCDGEVVATLKGDFFEQTWMPLDRDGKPCGRVEVESSR